MAGRACLVIIFASRIPVWWNKVFASWPSISWVPGDRTARRSGPVDDREICAGNRNRTANPQGLGRVHLLGHSWGGWLSIEYALAHPGALKSLILSSSAVADIPSLRSELDRLRAALGPETVAMMQRHEAEGRFDHPEYVGAITVLNYRHVCRLPVWPAPVLRSVQDWNMGPYGTMQGPK